MLTKMIGLLFALFLPTLCAAGKGKAKGVRKLTSSECATALQTPGRKYLNQIDLETLLTDLATIGEPARFTRTYKILIHGKVKPPLYITLSFTTHPDEGNLPLVSIYLKTRASMTGEQAKAFTSRLTRELGWREPLLNMHLETTSPVQMWLRAGTTHRYSGPLVTRYFLLLDGILQALVPNTLVFDQFEWVENGAIR